MLKDKQTEKQMQISTLLLNFQNVTISKLLVYVKVLTRLVHFYTCASPHKTSRLLVDLNV